MNWQMFVVFLVIFILVSAIGFWAARWKAGDLTRLQEWGLGGRRFGSVVSWFLIGGDMYTAYTFMAVPALVFAQGAQGFFAIPAFTLMYPIALVFMPRFWTIARHRGYLTTADFVRERFGSKTLALLVAITGILATMPYIAIQIYGMQIVLAQMGIPVEASMFIAFLILSAYTYVSGLRGPAVIAMIKDVMIWIVTITALIFCVSKIGGFDHVFAIVPQKKQILAPEQYSAYSTLILGSALALFLYPHAITGILSTNSRQVVKRTAALLLAYTFMQGLLGLLGFMAIAASIKASPVYQTNVALPALFTLIFPAWFAGFAFAAIAIGALVPASIMSIGAAHLFTRNIYREYIHPSCSASEESSVAKTTSLVIKAGALAFIVFVPTTFAINLQLLGNVWMLQTLPAVFIGLYTSWFHHRALIIGWATGMILGTWIAMTQNFASVFPLHLGTFTVQLYGALVALLVNLLVSSVLTLLFKVMHIPTGRDLTTPLDYEAYPALSQEADIPEALSILTPVTSVPPLRSIRPAETMLATPPVVLPPLQTPQLTRPLQSGKMRPIRVERMSSFDGQHGADAKIPEQRRE